MFYIVLYSELIGTRRPHQLSDRVTSKFLLGSWKWRKRKQSLLQISILEKQIHNMLSKNEWFYYIKLWLAEYRKSILPLQLYFKYQANLQQLEEFITNYQKVFIWWNNSSYKMLINALHNTWSVTQESSEHKL